MESKQEIKESKQEVDPKVVKVCIVGGGPAGLVCAASMLEEAEKNPNTTYEITLIEKRDFDFRRRQKLIITPSNAIQSLYKIKVIDSLRWDVYCQQLFDSKKLLSTNSEGSLVSEGAVINDLNHQRKFLRKVMRQKEYITELFFQLKNFSIKSLQNALLEFISEHKVKNVKIDLQKQVVIDGVNLVEGDITVGKLVDGKTISTPVPFDYLIDCEGEQRELVGLINNEIKDDAEKFHYTSMGKESYHFAVRLTVKEVADGDYSAFLNKQRELLSEQRSSSYMPIFDDDLNEVMEKLGWEESKDPLKIIDHNFYKESMNVKNWRPRLFIAGEIPQSIHDIKDPKEKREAILKWSRIIAARLMLIPEDCFQIDTTGEDEKHQLNAGTFVSKIKKVNNPVKQLPNGKYVVLVGDCAMSPYYPLGFSSTIALNEAVTVAKDIVQNTVEETQRFKNFTDKYFHYESVLTKIVSGSKDEKPAPKK